MCTQRTFPPTFKKTLSVDSHKLNYFECVCIKAIHYSRSVHITTKKIENSRTTPSNTPISKSPDRLIGKQLLKSHKIYPPCNVKKVPRNYVRSRRSATPKILSEKKFWSTCGPFHFIRPVTSNAGSVWGIVISICRPYSTTHRECERAPDASSAIPPRRYEEYQ
jgi:hypothetical protein